MHPGYYMVGDNVDLRTHVRHHRLNHGDLDAHMFQTAAYINRVPGNHLDPAHSTRDIQEALFSTAIPSKDDHVKLMSALASHVANTWAKYLKPFEGCHAPMRTHEFIELTKKKTERVSLGVLNKCENKNDEMLDIVKHVHGHVPGNQESEEHMELPIKTAFEGDYLTFERTKVAQTSKRNGRTPSTQLKGILARTAEFHNQAELMKAIWHHLYNQDSAVEKGTLFNAKSQLGATQVGSEPFKDFYASADLLDRFTISYIVSGGMKHFGMSTRLGDITENVPKGGISYEFLWEQALTFVKEFCHLKVFDTDADAPRSLKLECKYCGKQFKSKKSALISHELKAHGHEITEEVIDEEEQDYIYNYTCVSLMLCLIRWEHNDAIKHADGEMILLVDKFLTLIYKISQCPKYAFAMLETQCQVSILLSPRDAFLFKWNRTVNHRGEENTNFPNDQDLEHQNAVFKNEAKTYRGKFTERTRKRVSQSAQATEDIVKNYDRVTHVFRPSGKHSLPDWSDDIEKLVNGMVPLDLFSCKPHLKRRRSLTTPNRNVLFGLKVTPLKEWLKNSFQQYSRKHYYKY